jgi:predicted AAA+ superfamily ATPase
VAALGTGPERLLQDVETLGLLFESLVVRDLRIYAQTIDANVLHYREDSGLEVDAIVQRRDGKWAGFEVKLGQAAVDAAARSLLRVAERVDAERHGPPAALAVITGWGYAYRRPDGVGVIPVGALAP